MCAQDESNIQSMDDWTGERFVLGKGGAEIHHEHLHRYEFASGLVNGRHVLDLGCGTGTGAAMMAASGGAVIAIDIDVDTVARAAEQYPEVVDFRQGSAYEIPLPDSSLDLVACFEVIEHVDDPPRVISEIARVLRHDGLLVISTPMKAEYNQGLIKPNPFHLSEMEHAEFLALVEQELPKTLTLSQRSMLVSVLWTDEPNGQLEWSDTGPQLQGIRPVYEVVVATRDGVLPSAAASAYLDAAAQGEGEPEAVQQLRNARVQLGEWQLQIEALARALKNADARVDELEAQIAEHEGHDGAPR
jgi:2-polyprenyl-3-methyl-5-hydroxy-6-metoxy-1,4-benzoquinol methylase